MPLQQRNTNGTFSKGSSWRKRKPFWSREWCVEEYLKKRRSAKDIADQFGVGETAILYWLKKHKIKTRSMEETRAIKYWGLQGSANGMYGRRGLSNPNWKGGVTPERQAFYMTDKWKVACYTVWRRDRARCSWQWSFP